MSKHTTAWPAGTPCWVDLSATDQEAARAFYSGLFGWTYDIQPPEFGGYGVAKVNGASAAGVGGKMDAGQPSAWTTYLATTDATAAATKITEAGGAVTVPPMSVGPMGTMCIATDPTGAAFGVWQADQMIGAEVVNEAGGIIWNQQVSRDWDTAKAFYGTVFGLTAQALADAPDYAFNTLHVGGPPVGGIGAIDENSPPELPAHWLTYFAVLDTDATVARAVELGGQVKEPATDTPYGRQAELLGPEGELFAVMSVAPEGQPGSADSAE
jgi:uncharacterized protein